MFPFGLEHFGVLLFALTALQPEQRFHIHYGLDRGKAADNGLFTRMVNRGVQENKGLLKGKGHQL